ncbi:MAG TPA: folate-binding protein [Caulobacterales bacterium]|nr:folate-binding protein [Caulobacterales bacterium]
MTEPLRLDRALFTVRGPDTTEFLQNLVTNDVTLLARQPVIYAGILSPQGKVTADFMLWRTDEGVLLDVHAGAADVLRAKLMLYRLRAKVEIGPIEAGLGVFSGDLTGRAILSAADPRLPEAGLRAIALAQGAPPEAEPEAYRARRIEAGLPDLAHDAAPEEVFALEALFEELNGVDFQKGCFVGQENVSRMKRRATTRKKFCPVAFDGAAPPFGTAITAGAAEIGSIRTGIEGRAIALLRLDRAQEALEKGETLVADGKALHLAAPPWLIMPSATEAA